MARPDLGRLADELRSRLQSVIPKQLRPAILHGDYRIDNTILQIDPGRDPRVAAVVDWELSTIGDPVADVAMMCAYRHQAFDLIVGAPSAWTSPRLPDPEVLASAYEATSGVTLAGWTFHLGLAYYKVAVIAAGIDHRARAGVARGPGFNSAGKSVASFLKAGLETVRSRT